MTTRLLTADELSTIAAIRVPVRFAGAAQVFPNEEGQGEPTIMAFVQVDASQRPDVASFTKRIRLLDIERGLLEPHIFTMDRPGLLFTVNTSLAHFAVHIPWCEYPAFFAIAAEEGRFLFTAARDLSASNACCELTINRDDLKEAMQLWQTAAWIGNPSTA
jgi:hypothetical protein